MLEKILDRISPTKETDRRLISSAFEFAQRAHENQKRASGKPYITHSVAVAEILSSLNLDSATIVAGLLHDTLEDTSVTEEEIEKNFGKDVAFLVKGVTKLANIESKSQPKVKQELHAKYLRRIFFAMAEDVRVILIKLADRYHNMQTITDLPEDRRKRISTETLEIYGPIAERLGMGHIKGELEDMAFSHAYPEEYTRFIKLVKEKYADRQKYLERVKPLIVHSLKTSNIEVIDAHARAKHYFSLYKKFIKRERDLSRIYDLVALRIILPDIPSCYEALGIIHKNHKPLPGLIKDYIAFPKLNGYQSIHTTIFCEKNKILEIQLRTPKMHQYAENGIAAHWSYSESNKNKLHAADIKEAEWITQLKQWIEKSDSKEFLKTLRTNFFSDRVFVLTPKGDIKDLPEGSTPLDFAYAIHTDLGHTTKGAKVDGKLVPLDYKLKNGELVEIIKGKNPKPSSDWLRVVKSGEAKKKISSWLTPRQITATVKNTETKKPVRTDSKIQLTSSRTNLEIFTNGHKDILSATAKCCSPLPGHQILGYITKHRGITIHKTGCANVRRLNPEKIIEVNLK